MAPLSHRSIDTEFQYDVDSLSLEINFAIVGIMQSCDRDNFLALFEARCNFVYDNEPSKSVYNEENVLKLKALSEEYTCVQKIELLPFRKICQVKYDKIGIEFPFGHLPEPKKELMDSLNALLN